MSAPLRAVSPDEAPGVRLADHLRSLDAAAPAGDRDVLLGLARCYSDLVQTLVHDGGLTEDRAVKVLHGIAAEHAHPAARTSMVLLLATLVDAVERRARLECGQLDPADVVHGTVWTRSRMSLALEQLDREIEDALCPLLTGLPAGA
jgi:hypothetical protein